MIEKNLTFSFKTFSFNTKIRFQSLNNYDNFNPSKNFSIECTLYEKLF